MGASISLFSNDVRWRSMAFGRLLLSMEWSIRSRSFPGCRLHRGFCNNIRLFCLRDFRLCLIQVGSETCQSLHDAFRHFGSCIFPVCYPDESDEEGGVVCGRERLQNLTEIETYGFSHLPLYAVALHGTFEEAFRHAEEQLHGFLGFPPSGPRIYDTNGIGCDCLAAVATEELFNVYVALDAWIKSVGLHVYDG